MNFPNLDENEKRIRKWTDQYWTALDLYTDYASYVGRIISAFALVEEEFPNLLSLYTGLSEADSRAISGVFRAFSNRIDLFRAVYKARDNDSIEYVAGTHFSGLLTEANKIRNKYAHATYAKTGECMTLYAFSSDYNSPPKRLDQSLDDFQKDLSRINRIKIELICFVAHKEISASLHKQLMKLNPQQ